MAGSAWEDTAAIVEKLDTVIELLQRIADQSGSNSGASSSGD